MGTLHNIERKSLAVGGWVGGGGSRQKIMPLCGSILQDETSQILTLAEKPSVAKIVSYLKL